MRFEGRLAILKAHLSGSPITCLVTDFDSAVLIENRFSDEFGADENMQMFLKIFSLDIEGVYALGTRNSLILFASWDEKTTPS